MPVAETDESGREKTSLELLIERIEKIQDEIPEHEINPDEQAFTEAAEIYRQNTSIPKRGLGRRFFI